MITESMTEAQLRYNFPVPWGKMMRREFIVSHSINFDEVLAGDDEMFSLKCGYYAQRIIVAQDFLCRNMMRNNSVSRCQSFDFLLQRMRVLINLNKFILGHNVNSNMQRFCFEVVVNIKQRHGQRACLRALMIYLRNAPLPTMIHDFKRLMRFWLHKIAIISVSD